MKRLVGWLETPVTFKNGHALAIFIIAVGCLIGGLTDTLGMWP